ncbi:hypothetical protein JTB14_017974 [Gonioctena quinquepunctata]|nr:hypothetical protein JTB14_017974 [Gonioctena quinquepunctata]
MIATFNETISKFARNGYSIEDRINKISMKISDITFKFEKNLEIKGIFDQVTSALVIIDKLLLDLENVVVPFAKLNTVHPSIICIDNLENNIKTLGTILFGIRKEDIHKYYDLIELTTYNKNNRIVFILKFPVVNPSDFQYYHLYPTPNINLTTIIPPKPPLVMNDDYYQYLSDPCAVLYNTSNNREAQDFRLHNANSKDNLANQTL